MLKYSIIENPAFQTVMSVLANNKSKPCNRMRMARFNKKVADEVNSYLDERRALVKQYVEHDKDGQPVTTTKIVAGREQVYDVFKGDTQKEKEGNKDKLMSELKDLGDAEMELPELRLSWIIDSELTDGQYALIYDAITEDKIPEQCEKVEDNSDKGK